MINVNQITAQLARMPDQALQQYAQMHKDDPYVLSLALSESNRRKQTRQSAQMGGQEQPKVVDQELQGMAAPMPEDVGIGQLPAGDMNFADGGIVAFSDGGDVPRFRDEGLVAPRGFAQYGTPMTGKTGYEGMGPSELVQAIYEDLKKKIGPGLSPPEKAKAEREAQRQANMIAAGHVAPNPQGSAYSPEKYGVTKPAPLVPGARGAFFQEAAPPVDAAAAPDVGIGTSRPRVPPTGGPGAAPAAAAPGAASAAATAAPTLDAAALMETALKKAEGVKHPYAQELGDVGQAKVKAAEEKVAGLEAIQKQFSDIYKGRRERLDTKEAELGKLKDQGTGLALLQAGAAMMSTPGGFGTALGKGVKVGTEQYAAGLDKLRAAQEKLSDARDRLEEIEAQRGELSARELFKARSDVKDVGISVREDLIKANMQMYGLKREEAIKMVEQQIKVGTTQMDVAGRRDVALIGLQGQMAQAAATRASATEYRMAGLAESTRKNIMAEALKKYPYDVNAQNEYALAEIKRAVQANPALAQYMGVSGGGGASAGGTDYSKWGNLSTGK